VKINAGEKGDSDMDDERLWTNEEALWKGDEQTYRATIADEGLHVVPDRPHILEGMAAADAMADTPRWDEVRFSEKKASRPDGPEGGLIVIAYRAEAKRGEDSYEAWCSSTWLRRGHEDWVVVQHQQTPKQLIAG
jgi:hypothetical protein